MNAFTVAFAERNQLSGKRDLRLKRGERLYHELITDLIVEGQRLGGVLTQVTRTWPPGWPWSRQRLLPLPYTRRRGLARS